MNDPVKMQEKNTERMTMARDMATGILVLANGQVFRGQGCGAVGDTVGEVC